MIRDIQEEILKLKKEKDICILAHCYQNPEILEVADFTGDSFALSVKAAETKNKTVIMCGVKFMAETVKILSPDKTVLLANGDAGCPMAEMMDKDLIELMHKAIKDLDLYNHLGEKEKDIYARFFAYGLTGVIVDWTMAGMKEDEEELSKTLQSMVINTERIGYEFYMQRKKEKEGIK